MALCECYSCYLMLLMFFFLHLFSYYDCWQWYPLLLRSPLFIENSCEPLAPLPGVLSKMAGLYIGGAFILASVLPAGLVPNLFTFLVLLGTVLGESSGWISGAAELFKHFWIWFQSAIPVGSLVEISGETAENLTASHDLLIIGATTNNDVGHLNGLNGQVSTFFLFRFSAIAPWHHITAANGIVWRCLKICSQSANRFIFCASPTWVEAHSQSHWRLQALSMLGQWVVYLLLQAGVVCGSGVAVVLLALFFSWNHQIPVHDPYDVALDFPDTIVLVGCVLWEYLWWDPWWMVPPIWFFSQVALVVDCFPSLCEKKCYSLLKIRQVLENIWKYVYIYIVKITKSLKPLKSSCKTENLMI